MITNFKKYIMNESLQNFDLRKLVTIVEIKKDNVNWIYNTIDGRTFLLPLDQAGKITLIDDKFANFVNGGNPITKYFETSEGNNVITYAANFAVDAVALNSGRVYLIERKDGRGWALPGGFIDAGETPEQAVVRELQEETLAKPENIERIEPLEMIRANDPREINFFTYPFILHMKKPDELKYADDAKNGKWQLIGRASKSKLAFSHHNEVLRKVNF